jgi:hypothetical protein
VDVAIINLLEHLRPHLRVALLVPGNGGRLQVHDLRHAADVSSGRCAGLGCHECFYSSCFGELDGSARFGDSSSALDLCMRLSGRRECRSNVKRKHTCSFGHP